MSQETAKATFITFYSFKGGVGRSMALVNTAGILAGRRGFRVLVLDLDLEAPGLSYLDPELPDASPAEAQRQLPLQPGFVDLLSDAKERGQEADLFTLPAAEIEARYTQKIKIPDSLRQFPDGSLRIMPAGLFDSNYAQRLDTLNLSALYREGLGEPLIRAFKKRLAEAGLYNYVLVDSRTGMSEGAGICTRDLADHLMILSGLNRQNVEGTCEFLRELRAATEGKKKFQIILSPMPNGEDKLVDDRRAVAEKAFRQAWGARVDLSLEIPYHPQFALTEEPHIFRRRRGYLFEAYQAIEASMLLGLGHAAHAFRQRILESLDGQDYDSALRDLRQMIRLDEGDDNLSGLAEELMRQGELRRRSETEPSQEPVSIGRLLKDEGGRVAMEFIVDKLSLLERGWLTMRLLKELKQSSPELRARLLKRILEFEQTNANALGRYAVSFESEGYIDDAEVFYKQAIEADPNHAENLVAYAHFLRERGDMETAGALYRRGIEADPKNPFILGNYGQLLAGLGHLAEAQRTLLSALEHLDTARRGDTTEVCFSLWLVSRLQGHDAERSERCFKFLIQQGFKRYQWSFDLMLKQAEKKLSSEELEYAKAMAMAFLDESKVAELDRYERWRKLEPLNPKPQNPSAAS
ncbi:MAG: tetratricopeptide repeat protein [Verrucomicrobiota bacterium]|jgi:Tfp pilus assembly protein PilF